jgi:hypothetical protein
MKTVKTLAVLIAIMVLTVNSNQAFAQAKKKADKATREWRYETQCMGIGVDGTKLVKVWSYSKDPVVAIEQAKKNAVHAMIFQGFVGNSKTACATQKPLTDNPGLEQEKAQFFDAFFADGGKYMKFVNVSGDGSINPQDRVKIGKEYKIGIVVSVMYDQLRKDLEDAGIIKGLASGF